MADDQNGLDAVLVLQSRCEWLLNVCAQWEQNGPVEGLYRYTNALTTELQFLRKLSSDPSLIKKEYIQSSNLSFLESMHDAISSVEHVQEIMSLRSVPPLDDQTWLSGAALLRQRNVKADIVAENGLVWIKVIARNAKALRHDMAGLEEEDESDDLESDEESGHSTGSGPDVIEDGFSQLPIFKKAADYLRSAEAHHIHFRKPLVVFAFMRMQTDDVFVYRIIEKLREMGIVVYIASENTSLRTSYSSLLGDVEPDDLITSSLNLDVSTVLALISEMSHNPCRPDQVDGEPLQLQAAREKEMPILPVLKRLFRVSDQEIKQGKAKRLYMVQQAYDRLKDIIHVVGGPHEKKRYQYLFRNHEKDGQDGLVFDQELWTILPSLEIAVIPNAMSERFRKLLDPPTQKKGKLNNGRKIRTRFTEFHAIIFGSGDQYRMTTVTAIQWMSQALGDAGLTGIGIVSHEPRSLAEQKMTAPISGNHH